ncbi:FKBP-type peptidyl-prolyl cis-trans isomerase [Aestuariimicrobium ganziense]|uniref:FKBP-type peptidyl-prolyl cis-trans isomerase n=1 Tax=Aestuariimicrobium ganziense TaxID=2773677 RepID=UPI001940C96D|nr:FKBP-type peptidyl-prolyl cis-trans isomerase [Aestuariimicrobium ganziense]
MTRRTFDARLSRRGLTLAALSAAALGVAGCSDDTPAQPPASASVGAPQGSGSAVPSTTTSASASATSRATVVKNLNGITVTGGFGTMPTVKASWPISIEQTQSKVLVAGKGDLVRDESVTVEVHYSGYNARTGQRFDDSFTRKSTSAFPLNQVVTGFAKGLVGKRVGDRVLVMMPSKDGYAEGNPEIGVEPGDSLIFVVDLVQVSHKAPAGETVAPKDGLPKVTDNGSKAPTIAIGDATKPSDLVVQPLIKGKGRAIVADDIVMVNYTMVDWNGKVLAESYSTGPETGALSGLIEGWKQGLVKQTIGSRVLLLVPPALGYPKGNEERGLPAGESLAFVVDILFAQTPAS